MEGAETAGGAVGGSGMTFFRPYWIFFVEGTAGGAGHASTGGEAIGLFLAARLSLSVRGHRGLKGERGRGGVGNGGGECDRTVFREAAREGG